MLKRKIIYVFLLIVVLLSISMIFVGCSGGGGNNKSPSEIYPIEENVFDYLSETPAEALVKNPDTGMTVVKNELLVIKDENVLVEDMMQFIEQKGGAIVGNIPQINMYQLRFDGLILSDIEDLIPVFENSGYFVSVMIKGMVGITTWSPEESKTAIPKMKQNIDGYAYWNYDAIDLVNGWQLSKGSQNVLLANAETGFVDKDNIDDEVKGRIVSFNSSYSKFGKLDSNNDHAMHTLHTITSKPNNVISNYTTATYQNHVGICPYVKMNLYETNRGLFSGNEEVAGWDSLAAAIIIAADSGCSAISISLGLNWYQFLCTKDSDGYWQDKLMTWSNLKSKLTKWENSSKKISNFLKYAVEYAKQKDLIIVKAAGNDSSLIHINETPSSSPSYIFDTKKYDILGPLAEEYPNNLLIIGSAKPKWYFWPQFPIYERSGFSNYGENVIFAPGSHIYSVSINDFNQYYLQPKSGTSMAAPHVTALIGLIKGRNPGLKPDEIVDAIKQGARNANNQIDLNLSTATPTNMTGDYYLINVEETLKLIGGDTKAEIWIWDYDINPVTGQVDITFDCGASHLNSLDSKISNWTLEFSDSNNTIKTGVNSWPGVHTLTFREGFHTATLTIEDSNGTSDTDIINFCVGEGGVVINVE